VRFDFVTPLPDPPPPREGHFASGAGRCHPQETPRPREAQKGFQAIRVTETVSKEAKGEEKTKTANDREGETI
jgi:hypothetical protein